MTSEVITQTVTDAVDGALSKARINQKIESLTEQVTELQAAAGRVGSGSNHKLSLREKLEDVIFENKDNFFKTDGGRFDSVEFIHRQKVVGTITSANLTGGTYYDYLSWEPGMSPRTKLPGVRDILRIIPSSSDTVIFPRAKTPPGEGSFGQQRTEGANKAQVDYDWEAITVNLYPMAGWSAVSRQSLRNIPFLQETLPGDMMESLKVAENLQFGAELYAAATGVTTNTGFTGPAEQLIAYLRNLMKANHGATAILVSPDVWAKLLIHRPGTDNPYSLPYGMNITANGVATIVATPVIPVSFLTGGQVIVGDFTKAAIIESESLTLRQSDSHDTYFIKNLLTFLLERTEALAIFRPEAFIATTVSLS